MTTQISDTFWQDYITEAMNFAVLPLTDSRAADEALFGLIEETGEVAGVFKRAARGDNGGELDRDKLTKELGDLLWYTVRRATVWEQRPRAWIAERFSEYFDPNAKAPSIQQAAAYLCFFADESTGQRILWLFRLAPLTGLSLREVATKNLEKLLARKQAGTIQGSGDNR